MKKIKSLNGNDLSVINRALDNSYDAINQLEAIIKAKKITINSNNRNEIDITIDNLNSACDQLEYLKQLHDKGE